MPQPPKRLFSLKEAGVYLGRSQWSVADMVRRGKLPFVPDGKRKLLDIEDLDRWILKEKVIIDDGTPIAYTP